MPILTLSDFGRYTLIFTIATQITFLTKSFIYNPMIKIAAEPGRFRETAVIGFWAAGLIQIIIFITLWLFAPVGEKIFRLEPNDFLIAGTMPLIFWIRDWGFCVQQTLYHTRRLFWIEFVYWGGISLGFVWFRFMGLGGLRELFTIIYGAAALSSLSAVVVWPSETQIFSRIDRNTVRELFNYGFYSIGLGLSAGLLAGADLIILGAIYNSEIVGIYGGAKRIYMVVAALVSTAGLLVIPYASKLAAEKRLPEIRALFEKTVAYMATGMGLAVGAGWLLAEPFYRLILPAAYIESIPCFQLLLIAAPFEGLFYITTAILYGMGAAGITVMTSSMALGLLVVLLPTAAYFFGITGTAVAQVTVTAFVGVLMTARAGRKVGGEWGTTMERLSICFSCLFGKARHR